MKLAEALIERASAQKRLEQLRQRAQRNALIQEGAEPAEQPAALLEEFERTAARLTALIAAINVTNTGAALADGTSLTAALARRDVLKLRHATYRDLAEAATVDQHRYMRSELRFVATVDVAETQRRADDLARELRELDLAIQRANWETDLIER